MIWFVGCCNITRRRNKKNPRLELVPFFDVSNVSWAMCASHSLRFSFVVSHSKRQREFWTRQIINSQASKTKTYHQFTTHFWWSYKYKQTHTGTHSFSATMAHSKWQYQGETITLIQPEMQKFRTTTAHIKFVNSLKSKTIPKAFLLTTHTSKVEILIGWWARECARGMALSLLFNAIYLCWLWLIFYILFVHINTYFCCYRTSNIWFSLFFLILFPYTFLLLHPFARWLCHLYLGFGRRCCCRLLASSHQILAIRTSAYSQHAA